MINQVLLTVNAWMAGGTAVAALGCFLWGLISVLLSPCHMASVPLVISYVAGQEKNLGSRQAASYAVLFTSGLFITIALLGIICSLFGRMLGDVSPYWTVLVGAVLVWVALDMLGVAACSVSGGALNRIKIKGLLGAFVLGLFYGVLSGSCTFGFIAPILAVITIQQKILTGILLITLFGIGHCVPIAVAGSSTAIVKQILENRFLQKGGIWLRRFAGVFIGTMGLYFIIRPFFIA